MATDQYLKHVEEAYKQVSQAVTTVGLYLTPPFSTTTRGQELVSEIRDDLKQVEEMLRELYQVERP